MKPPGGGDNERFLSRWSRLKRAGVQPAAGGESAAAVPATKPVTAPGTTPTATAAPSAAKSQTPAARAASEVDAIVASLPPVESLTIDSDFSPFLQPKVDAALKRQALKQLFRDPHFNVMDGLDIYIGDYSQPDPISPEIVRQMVQARYIFDPPPTRINAQGFVEDIPAEELATLEADASAAADALPEPDAEAAGIPTLSASPEAAAVASTPSASEPAVEPGVEPPPAEASEKIHQKPQ